MLNLAIPISTLLLLLLLWTTPLRADVACDGTDDSVGTGVNLSVFMSDTVGTYMLWYKSTGTPRSSGPGCAFGEFLLGFSTTDSYAQISRHNNHLGNGPRLCTTGFDSDYRDVSSPFTANAWTHLAAVHTGGNLLLYKDGTLAGSVALGAIASTSRALTMCGGNGAAVFNGEGVFTAVQVFPTALTAQEIAVIAQSRLHRVATSVASGTWDFAACGDGVACSGLVFTDRSGNNRPFTAGAAGTGGTGRGGEFVGYPWGVE